VGIAALGVALVSAYLLVPWAWDALGYHLPIVHDALATGALREVPTHCVYVNAYPRAVDLYFVYVRALLGSDTWIDAAQVPFGLTGALAVAALARRAGVLAPRALGLSLLFLAIPVCALQLATNYVDVAYASLLLVAVYFATQPVFGARALYGGAALGLFLATKPSAPVSFVLVSLVVVALGYRARRLVPAATFVLTGVAVGAAKYIENLLRHGNPLWPVRVKLGPVLLPGEHDLAEFFVTGVPEPYLSMGWIGRTFGSFLASPERYVYDMRIGGFGPLFVFVLLPALALLLRHDVLRRVGLPVMLLSVCALATPGAYWSRYVLAFPAALLVTFAVGTASWEPRARRAVDLVAAGFAAFGLWLALPGFTDGGPSLLALARMDPAARERAVNVDGRGADWQHAMALLAEGDTFAYDDSADLVGLLWHPEGGRRVVYMPHAMRSKEAARDWLEAERVRLVLLGDGSPLLEPEAAAALGITKLFGCAFESCAVYLVAKPTTEGEVSAQLEE
jgi:hypothetical protein